MSSWVWCNHRWKFWQNGSYFSQVRHVTEMRTCKKCGVSMSGRKNNDGDMVWSYVVT